MKHYLLILLAFILVCPILAQDKNEVMSEKLKNRIWKAKILEGIADVVWRGKKMKRLF